MLRKLQNPPLPGDQGQQRSLLLPGVFGEKSAHQEWAPETAWTQGEGQGHFSWTTYLIQLHGMEDRMRKAHNTIPTPAEHRMEIPGGHTLLRALSASLLAGTVLVPEQAPDEYLLDR